MTNLECLYGTVPAPLDTSRHNLEALYCTPVPQVQYLLGIGLMYNSLRETRNKPFSD